MKSEVRIDKWMWAVRLFKTRSLAADMCKKGKVYIGTTLAKPSRMVKIGDVVAIKKGGITHSFKVLALSENRMGAKLVPDFMINVTTSDQLELIEMQRLSNNAFRDRGAGRPTKKDRRDIEEFTEDFFWWNDDVDDED